MKIISDHRRMEAIITADMSHLEMKKQLCLRSADNYLNFNVSDYTVEELAGKRHNFELEPASGSLTVAGCADDGHWKYSCGPDSPEESTMRRIPWKVQLQIEEL